MLIVGNLLKTISAGLIFETSIYTDPVHRTLIFEVSKALLLMSLYALVQIIIFAGPGAVSWLMYTTTTAAFGSDSSSNSTSWYIGSLLESKISTYTSEF